MFFLDTNFIYYLTDCDINNNINPQIKEFIKKDNYDISYYSFFEIANNPNKKDKFFKIFDTLFKNYPNYNIITHTGFDEYINDQEFYAFLQNKNLFELKKHLLPFIKNQYAYFIQLRLDYIIAVYLSFFNYEKDIQHTKFQQKFFDKNSKTTKQIILEELEYLINNDLFTEKNIKELYENLVYNIISNLIPFVNIVNSYVTLVKKSAKNGLRYKYKHHLLLKRVNGKLKRKPNGWKFNQSANPINDIKVYAKTLFPNQSENELNEQIKNYLRTLIYQKSKLYDFEEIFFEYQFQNIFLAENTLRSNDFIDFHILGLYFLENTKNKILDDYIFLTTDKRFISWMSKVNNEKVKKSCEFIKRYINKNN
ncbi:MAG: hypothetical protein DBX59_00170 [Bacillota bacterium]|nr:MAG: hypothetical protein DBX59_00170 [Bacillota bacterium]